MQLSQYTYHVEFKDWLTRARINSINAIIYNISHCDSTEEQTQKEQYITETKQLLSLLPGLYSDAHNSNGMCRLCFTNLIKIDGIVGTWNIDNSTVFDLLWVHCNCNNCNMSEVIFLPSEKN